MNTRIFKISAGFLIVSILALTTSMYVSLRDLAEQQQLAATGKVDQALATAGSATIYNPFDPDPFLAQANLFRSQGKFDEAEDMLRRAIEKSPNDYEIYLDLGSLQLAKGDYAAAEKSYLEVRRLNPRASAASEGLARSMVLQGKIEGAREEYERLQSQNETREGREAVRLPIQDTYDFGRVCVRTGDPEKGFKLINQALRRLQAQVEESGGAASPAQSRYIESMRLSAADALVAQREYDRAYRWLSETESDQVPGLLGLISADPEGYRESVINNEIY